MRRRAKSGAAAAFDPRSETLFRNALTPETPFPDEERIERSPFSRGAEDGGDEGVVEPAAGAVLQFGDDRGDRGEMPVLLGEDDAAEDAGGDHPSLAWRVVIG